MHRRLSIGRCAMDVRHLAQDELDSELLIRGINAHDENSVDMLIATIEAESRGEQAKPKIPPGIRHNSEARACRQKLDVLKEEVSRIAQEAIDSDMPVLNSRFIHLIGRIERLHSVDQSFSVNSLVKELDELGKYFESVKESLGSDESLSEVENVVSEAAAAPDDHHQNQPPTVSTTSQDVLCGQSNTPGIGQQFIQDVYQSQRNSIGCTSGLGPFVQVSPPHSDGGIIHAMRLPPSTLQQQDHAGPTNTQGATSQRVGQLSQTLGRTVLSSQTRDKWGLPSTSLAGTHTFSSSIPRMSTGTSTGATRKIQQPYTNWQLQQQPENLLLNEYSFQPPQVLMGNRYDNSWRTQGGASNTIHTLTGGCSGEQQQHQQGCFGTAMYGSNQTRQHNNATSLPRAGPQYVAPQQQQYQPPNDDLRPESNYSPAAHQQGVQQQHPPQQPNQNRPGYLHQMSKWNIKYCGSSSDMHVDEFTFRAATLSRSANIDLDMLPLGMHYLLHGEAQEWFWVFHREFPQADWNTFTDAMRNQFAPTENEFEVWDKIRGRKQRQSENFGQFYVAVVGLASRLRQRMSEANMVDLLRSNMKLELKNALLYHPTRTVRDLQEAAKKFEKLSNPPIDSREVRQPSRRVNEIVSSGSTFHSPTYPQQSYPFQAAACSYVDSKHQDYPDQIASDFIEAVSKQSMIVCWNCDDLGHTFHDCVVATRNVFCYGCGAKNTYKPSCLRCSQGNARSGGPNQPATVRPTPSAARPTQGQIQILRKPNPFATQ